MKTTVVFVVCMLACGSTAMAVTYYVDINNSTPSVPYTSWGTAANDIQSAVDQTANDDTVLVAEGHYYLTSEIVVTQDITIQSMTDPAGMVVDGNGVVRRFNMGNAHCVVSGFTLKWNHALGWNSAVMYSTNLVSMPFTNLSVSLTYPINSYTDLVHRAENECFYRVDLEP